MENPSSLNAREHELPIVTADYKTAALFEHRGNKPIEALPLPMSDEELFPLLAKYPHFDPVERQLPTHLRQQCVMRLRRYLDPMDEHFLLAQRIDAMLRDGYVNRNFVSTDFRRQLQQSYERLSGGELPAELQNEDLTALAMAVLGLSGMGKTRGILRILERRYPRVIYHPAYGQFQVVWIHLNATFDSSAKQLCVSFFIELDRLLGTTYQDDFKVLSKGTTTVQLMLRIAHLCRLHHIGIIALDEIQHLEGATVKVSERTMSFLVTFANIVGVPVLLMGTNKARNILQLDFRQARRSTGFGMLYWDRLQGDAWRAFAECLLRFQWTRNQAPLTDELLNTLWDLSQGVVDVAIKLIMVTQATAMVNGTEMITPAGLLAVAKKEFQLLEPMISAMRSNDIRRIAKFDDVSPLDVDGVLAKLMRGNGAALSAMRQKAALPVAENHLALSIMAALKSTGVGEDVAEGLARQVIASGEATDAVAGLKAALALLEPKAKRPPSARKGKRKEEDLEVWKDLKNDDLRFVYRESRMGGKSIHAGLIGSGYTGSAFLGASAQ
jgi:hypothetical protein